MTTNPDLPKLYARHQSYVYFRWLFLFFIASPTLLMFLRLSVLDWQSYWLYRGLEELTSWGTTVGLVVVFQPRFGMVRVFELVRRSGAGGGGAGAESEEEAE